MKTQRFEMLLSEANKALFKRAAASVKKSMGAFLTDAGVAKAKDVLGKKP